MQVAEGVAAIRQRLNHTFDQAIRAKDDIDHKLNSMDDEFQKTLAMDTTRLNKGVDTDWSLFKKGMEDAMEEQKKTRKEYAETIAKAAQQVVPLKDDLDSTEAWVYESARKQKKQAAYGLNGLKQLTKGVSEYRAQQISGIESHLTEMATQLKAEIGESP